MFEINNFKITQLWAEEKFQAQEEVSKMEEEAGPDVLVSSVYGGRFYIKVMRASDDTNTSYYFEGLAFTGAEKKIQIHYL